MLRITLKAPVRPVIYTAKRIVGWNASRTMAEGATGSGVSRAGGEAAG